MPLDANLIRPIAVFFSYADEDKTFLEDLLRHLNSLVREGLIRCFHRSHIPLGGAWREQVRKDMQAADIVLLLVSSYFIASDYCFQEEILPVMKRYKNGEARIIPVILRPVEWEQLAFGGLKSLPEGKAVSMWSNQEEALSNIAKGVKGVLDDLKIKLRDAFQNSEKPIPLWDVPYWRNQFFTGREDVIAGLRSGFTSAHPVPIQALSGLPGVGKTQLVVEYAYRYADMYQAVLWVRADSSAIIQSGFIELAETLTLAESGETNYPLMVKAVKQWLQQNAQWLLIVDNLEDVNLLRDLIPSPHPGHILVTTRSHRTGGIARRVALSPLPLDDGAFFLLRRSKLLAFQDNLNTVSETELLAAREIVRLVGGLPLALDQAGAYIEETGRGLREYVDLYHDYTSSLLERRGTSGQDHPASVITTFALSLAQVRSLNEAALELLTCCAFLHPDGIPKDLLVAGAAELPSPLVQTVAHPLELDRAIEDLLKFSLIHRQTDKRLLMIHRLVQVVVQNTISEEQKQEYIEQLTRVLNLAFPSGEFRNWAACQRYLPQARFYAQLIQQQQIRIPEATHLLHRVGTYVFQRGLYPEAEELLKQALSLEERRVGKEHPDLVPLLNTLAAIYNKKGKYTLVEPLLRRVLAANIQPSDQGSSDLVESLSALARAYHKQGRYNEAEPLLERVLALQRQTLPPQHPEIATILSNLAKLYNRQGKYTQAETFYKQALAIRQLTLDAQHPDLASTFNNLAVLYGGQHKYELAAPLYEQAHAIYEQTLGTEHPTVALVLQNLANSYVELGRYVEAEPLYHKVFQLARKTLDAEHPDFVLYYGNFAKSHLLQGKYTEAETNAQQALLLGEKVLGPNHHRVETVVERLADIYKVQGRFGEAERFYQRALTIREEFLHLEDISTAILLEKYADLFRQMERQEEVALLWQRAQVIRNELSAH